MNLSFAQLKIKTYFTLFGMFRAVFSRQTAILWALVSAFCILAGPFGTFDGLALLQRTWFWIVMSGVGICCAAMLRYLLYRTFKHTNRHLRSLIEAALFAALTSPLFVALARVVAKTGQYTEPPLWQVMGYCLFIHLIVQGVRVLLPSPVKPPENMTKPALPRLAQRFENPSEGKVLHLTVNDHYVEATLENHCERLLMRLADAIREMDGVPGFSVHRSHWVAADAIAGTERRNNRDFVVLTNGALVPVSRTYRGSLIQAGILPVRN